VRGITTARELFVSSEWARPQVAERVRHEALARRERVTVRASHLDSVELTFADEVFVNRAVSRAAPRATL